MQHLISFLSAEPYVFGVVIFILSLLVGSFLNVVIYRLPIMLEREWDKDCLGYLSERMPELKLPDPDTIHTERFNLNTPASRCPKCATKIKPWQNIPLVSYMVQKGQCAQCHVKISLQYPLVELFTALLSLAVAMHFGANWQGISAVVLTWALVALSGIDYHTKLLPDNITLPLMWLGLLININHTFVPLQDAVIGAAAGYLSLWSVYQVFKLLTGKEGMGFGDFKLLAVFGAWLGWSMLPAIIMISSAAGAIIGVSLIASKQLERSQQIPFGPYIAIGGWIALLWGSEINAFYLTHFM